MFICYLIYIDYILYSHLVIAARRRAALIESKENVMDAGLVIGRVVFGGLMAAHGAQKYFGWFGGYGLDAVGGMFESLGFRPGRLFAGAAAVSEILSGLLIAFGLLGPVGPALMLSVMIVAAVSAHWQHGLFAMNNGIEVPLLYAAVAALLALTGPGAYSLDAALGLSTLWTPAVTAVVLAAGIAGAVGNLAVRKVPATAAA
jgi:putative oxidoreductase